VYSRRANQWQSTKHQYWSASSSDVVRPSCHEL